MMFSTVMFRLVIAICQLTNKEELTFLGELLQKRIGSLTDLPPDPATSIPSAPPERVVSRTSTQKKVYVRPYMIVRKGKKIRLGGYHRYMPGTSPLPKSVRERNLRKRRGSAKKGGRKNVVTTNAEVFGIDVDPRKVLPAKFLEAFRTTGGDSKRLILTPQYRDLFVGRVKNYMTQNNMTLSDFVRAVRPAIRSDQAFRFWDMKMASPQAKTVVMILRKLNLKPAQLGLPDVAL